MLRGAVTIITYLQSYSNEISFEIPALKFMKMHFGTFDRTNLSCFIFFNQIEILKISLHISNNIKFKGEKVFLLDFGVVTCKLLFTQLPFEDCDVRHQTSETSLEFGTQLILISILLLVLVSS